MRQRELLKTWVEGRRVSPQGLWVNGSVAFSYGEPIAKRILTVGDVTEIVMIPGPRFSLTTQRHRGLVKVIALELGIPIVSPDLN